jgi:hypothetical protein
MLPERRPAQGLVTVGTARQPGNLAAQAKIFMESGSIPINTGIISYLFNSNLKLFRSRH